MVLARRRIHGHPTITVHVPHYLTKRVAALVLSRHPRYEPGRGVSERYGLSLITDQLTANRDAAADPTGLTACETAEDVPADQRGEWAAFTGALEDVGRWRAFPDEDASSHPYRR